MPKRGVGVVFIQEEREAQKEEIVCVRDHLQIPSGGPVGAGIIWSCGPRQALWPTALVYNTLLQLIIS